MTSHEEYLLRTGRMKDQDGNLVCEGSLVAFADQIWVVDHIAMGAAILKTSTGKKVAHVDGAHLLLVAK